MKKIKPPKYRSVNAKALELPMFKHKIIKSKKVYSRKQEKIRGDTMIRPFSFPTQISSIPT